MTLIAKLFLYTLMTTFVVMGAHAHEIEQGVGVVCDTKEQIARFVALDANPLALKTVNDEATHIVCARAEVQYIRGHRVATYRTSKGALEAVEILVLAVNMHGWAHIEPSVQYTIFPINEEGASLPGITLVADNGQWELTDPLIRNWFESLRMPDNAMISCCGLADAYYADKIYTRDGKNIAVITDDRPDGPLQRPHVPIGTEIVIPDHKMKWDRGNPTGHKVIFLSSAGANGQRDVYCFVDDGGV